MIAERDFAGRQSRGKRESQQDAYAFAEIGPRNAPLQGLLLVLADGMGGHQGGERASRLAVEHFVREYQNSNLHDGQRFTGGLAAANAAIAEVVHANSQLAGMGTTVLAVSLTPTTAEWISVGDSALYLLRGLDLSRLNADHSFRTMLEEKVRLGELTPEEAATDPHRSKLRSAVMGGEIALVDHRAQPFVLSEGDILVAATDGLEVIYRESLLERLVNLRTRPAGEIAAALLQAVKDQKHPKQDNTTIAVMKVRAVWPRPMATKTHRRENSSLHHSPTHRIITSPSSVRTR